MENAVEALKFAGAVMIFAFALTITISSFSSANLAVKSIVNMRDRESKYTYVKGTNELTRTVGIETVVPAMYRAYKENIEIHFYEADGTPLVLYYKTDNNGEKIIENGNYVGINYIDLEFENFASAEEATKHLNILLGNAVSYDGEYKNQICHLNGLYSELAKYKFEESFGEYYQGTEATKIKKRVITYKIQGSV